MDNKIEEEKKRWIPQKLTSAKTQIPPLCFVYLCLQQEAHFGRLGHLHNEVGEGGRHGDEHHAVDDDPDVDDVRQRSRQFGHNQLGARDRTGGQGCQGGTCDFRL